MDVKNWLQIVDSSIRQCVCVCASERACVLKIKAHIGIVCVLYCIVFCLTLYKALLSTWIFHQESLPVRASRREKAEFDVREIGGVTARTDGGGESLFYGEGSCTDPGLSHSLTPGAKRSYDRRRCREVTERVGRMRSQSKGVFKGFMGSKPSIKLITATNA